MADHCPRVSKSSTLTVMQILTIYFDSSAFYRILYLNINAIKHLHQSVFPEVKVGGKGDSEVTPLRCLKLLIKEAFPGISTITPRNGPHREWTGEGRPDPIIPQWKEITDLKKFPAGLTSKASHTPVFKSWILMQRIHGWAQLTKAIQTRDSTFKRPNGWTFAECPGLLPRCHRRGNWGPQSWRPRLALSSHFTSSHCPTHTLPSFPNLFSPDLAL